MKQVRDLLKFDVLKSKIVNAIQKELDTEFASEYKKLPKFFFVINSQKYIIFMILTIFFPLMFILFLINNNKYVSEIKNSLNLQEIYKKGCNQINGIKFIKSENDKSVGRTLKLYKTDEIPSDAIIVKYTNIKFFSLLDKYECEIQTGLARWVRNYGKNTRVYYKNTGYIIIRNIDVWKDFNFQLHNKRQFAHKRILMENEKFNKEFNFYGNDEVKSRMMLTPLSMEKLIEQKAAIDLRWWTVAKNNEQILIRFKPKKWYSSEVKLSMLKSGNHKYIETQAINEIVNAVFLFYSLVGIVLIPPFL